MAKDFSSLRKIIGNNVKKYRKSAGFTQKDLGIQADLNELYISQIERGIGTPSIQALFRISEILNIEIESFFKQ